MYRCTSFWSSAPPFDCPTSSLILPRRKVSDEIKNFIALFYQIIQTFPENRVYLDILTRYFGDPERSRRVGYFRKIEHIKNRLHGQNLHLKPIFLIQAHFLFSLKLPPILWPLCLPSSHPFLLFPIFCLQFEDRPR